jgi:hypothetical protein
MTALLIGIAIGLFLAAVIDGYRIRRARALRDLEEEIPAWVNQANRQRPVVISLAQLEDEINFALWEDELEDLEDQP